MPVTKLGKCTWGGSELGAVARGAFGLIGPAQARVTLTDALQDLGYRAPLFFLNSGSLALRVALEEMRIQRPERNVVVIPAYCCPAVPNVVRALGLSPRAAPVGADLNLDLDRLGALLGGDVLAVVGVHMYALPLDFRRLRSLVEPAGAYLIDDAAHAVERVSGDNLPLGLGGDVGLLSFNQSKTLTGGAPNGGGALVVTNNALLNGVARRVDALADGKSVARNYAWFALRYALEFTPRALTEYIPIPDQHIRSTLGAQSVRSERMGAAAALAVRAQIDRLPEITRGRTALTAHYLEALQDRHGLHFVQTRTPRYLSRMFVRWDAGPHAGNVREAMTRRGHAARKSYPQWTDENDPHSIQVRHIMATHLELPGSPRLNKAAVDELIADLALTLKSES
jgi:dTDP-4-amino-4,6-dideoxygalactose transaminase